VLLCDDGYDFVGVEQRADAPPRLAQQALIPEHTAELFWTGVALDPCG
jgi:hypothetical protein